MYIKRDCDNEICVTICCLAYNHESYIRQALESFVKQRTNFKYEVIVHDDASTDRTAEIIKEYEKKYPEIIKPIYQAENQYSKKIKITLNYIYPKAKGKYIALCEGDDYWIDEYKLQKQVDFMEKHSDYSAIISGAETLNPDGSKGEVVLSDTNRTISVEEFILAGGGGFSTNTLLYRLKYAKEYPDFHLNCSVGDYPLILQLAFCGKVFYLKDKTAVYRICSNGSWTERVLKSSFGNYEKHYAEINKMLEEFDIYSNKKYTEAVNTRIELNNKSILERMRKESWKTFKKPQYAYLKKYTSKVKWYYYQLYLRFKLVRILANIRNKINNKLKERENG